MEPLTLHFTSSTADFSQAGTASSAVKKVLKDLGFPNTVIRRVSIAMYEAEPEDTLHLSSVLDMREPAGRGDKKQDGARQQMGMYTKDSAFNRVMKLQEALYKVQGRIAAITNSLRAMEEADRRIELERQRLEILRMRATGAVPVGGPEDETGTEYDPLTESEDTV